MQYQSWGQCKFSKHWPEKYIEVLWFFKICKNAQLKKNIFFYSRTPRLWWLHCQSSTDRWRHWKTAEKLPSAAEEGAGPPPGPAPTAGAGSACLWEAQAWGVKAGRVSPSQGAQTWPQSHLGRRSPWRGRPPVTTWCPWLACPQGRPDKCSNSQTVNGKQVGNQFRPGNNKMP
jgi:hypothetical protein